MNDSAESDIEQNGAALTEQPPQGKAKQKSTTRNNPSEVLTRDIRRPVESMLWGRSAGRCQFDGCNRVLSRSSVTQEQANVAQKAHIWAFSADGPRGHAGVSEEELNDIDNLMLVCHECHVKIDQVADGGRYTATLLRAWKQSHEQRIATVTGIAPNRRSHVLMYGANVGDHASPFTWKEASDAMFPDRYPVEAVPITLGTTNSSLADKSPDYWQVETTHLRTQFDRRVRERVSDREVEHLSVFALAPQPLLILLGHLLGDIVPADVYQRHREPATWKWPAVPTPQPFIVTSPAQTDGRPALVLSLSGTVTEDRITSVLGNTASVWKVTVPTPHNDFVKSRDQVEEFRVIVRQLLDRIKAVHGQTTELHVFPVAPVSLAVELGRVRMPKAEMPWRLYDQVAARGGFVPTLSLSEGVSA